MHVIVFCVLRQPSFWQFGARRVRMDPQQYIVRRPLLWAIFPGVAFALTWKRAIALAVGTGIICGVPTIATLVFSKIAAFLE
ncbi:MAG: hypothetical protein M3Z14_02380 [Candidatus Eremiobacteraeota bacterium]|nr:hypothetical protein [Candidatus Eremiobacteraeota bacterium]